VIVECRANTGAALPPAWRNDATGMTVEAEFPVTIGARYVVYAFTVFDGYTWFYVLDDDDRAHPIWYPAAFFEVIDPTIPDDWVFGYVRTSTGEDEFPIVSFPEWALDERYYESLVDGEPSAVAVFARRRASAER
jgi:hypothetical protein